MEVTALFCPKCGGKISLPEGTRSCYCGYCGSQLLIDDGSRTVTYRTVDEARIRESDNEAALELKKLELEEASRARRMKALKVLAIGCAALFALALIVGMFDVLTGMLIGEVAFLALLFGAMMLLMPHRSKNGASDEDDEEEEDEDGVGIGILGRRASHRGGSGGIAAGVAAATGLAIGLLLRK